MIKASLVGAAVGLVVGVGLTWLILPKTHQQETDLSHAGHDMSATSAHAKAFAEVNAAMHKDMAIEFSEDADRDFVLGMIPHHQGAVDMAKIVLEYGDDPEIRAMAEAIIAAQEDEISRFYIWLAKNPAP